MRRHVVALVVLLGVALALSHRNVGFSTDEGSYAIQSEALDRGSWEIDWPFREVDPTGAHFPYHGGRLTESPRGEYAYVNHPIWPELLASVRSLGGEGVGLRLLPMASVVVAALCGAALARRMGGPVAGPWGFWVVATSPVLADGLMIWAHAPSAALAGLAVLAAVELETGKARWWWWALLCAALAGGVLVRSEGAFVVAAVAGLLALIGLRRREWRLVGAGVLGAGAGAGALLLEWAWAAGYDGAGLTSRADSSGFLGDRLHGAGVSLLRGASDPGAALISLLAVSLVVLAVVASRRTSLAIRPELVVGAAAVLVVVRTVVGHDDPVPGLLSAWPALAFAGAGVVAAARRALPVALLVGATGFGLAVVATQYDDGGGLQWGGRFLAPLLVPTGAVAAVGLLRVLPSPSVRRTGAALLAATALASLVITDQIRETNLSVVHQVDATGQPVVLVAGDQIARLDWSRWPERCWISDRGDLRGALAALREAGVDHAAYVGFEPIDLTALGASARPVHRGALVGVVDLRFVPTPTAVGEHAFAGCPGPVA